MPPTIAATTPSPSLNSKLREKSPELSPSAAMPMTTMSTRPKTSIAVSTRFTWTDSAIPRMLIAATIRIIAIAASTSGRSTNSDR